MSWVPIGEPDEEEIRELARQYGGKARFLVDESAGEEVARYLTYRGHNTKFVSALGLTGHSDEDVYAAAWRERRIIITHDADFLNDRRFPRHRNPGIVLIRPGSDGRDSIGLIRCLMRMLWIVGRRAKWCIGTKIEFLSDGSLKIERRANGRITRTRYLWNRNSVMEWFDD